MSDFRPLFRLLIAAIKAQKVDVNTRALEAYVKDPYDRSFAKAYDFYLNNVVDVDDSYVQLITGQSKGWWLLQERNLTEEPA